MTPYSPSTPAVCSFDLPTSQHHRYRCQPQRGVDARLHGCHWVSEVLELNSLDECSLTVIVTSRTRILTGSLSRRSAKTGSRLSSRRRGQTASSRHAPSRRRAGPESRSSDRSAVPRMSCCRHESHLKLLDAAPVATYQPPSKILSSTMPPTPDSPIVL